MARSFKSTSRSGAAHVAFDHGNGVGHYIVVAPFVHDVATPVELRVGSGSEWQRASQAGRVLGGRRRRRVRSLHSDLQVALDLLDHLVDDQARYLRHAGRP
ncbi:MAG TPA: hypothetical protein VKB56_04905 [Terriglobales bacterium]|nr:hypothetical protein [Terriglobales bacterium]